MEDGIERREPMATPNLNPGIFSTGIKVLTYCFGFKNSSFYFLQMDRMENLGVTRRG